MSPLHSEHEAGASATATAVLVPQATAEAVALDHADHHPTGTVALPETVAARKSESDQGDRLSSVTGKDSDVDAKDLRHATETDQTAAAAADLEKLPASGSGSEEAATAHGNSKHVVLTGEARYMTGRKLLIVHSAMLLAVLLVALDQSIVATAIPRIVSQFNALPQVSWIASAYFLTQAGFILWYGCLLTIFPTKYVFLVAVFLFEAGSLVCAVAPDINVLIFGRAFAGVGAAGMFGSVIAIITEIAPLQMRPALFGSFGGVFAVSSVMGPLLGGVFTDHVSWRWCFYVNLPIGGLAAFVILVAVKAGYSGLNDPRKYTMSPARRFIRLDWIGTALCVGLVVCLLLPLQWGGNTKPWDDPVVDTLLGVFGALLIVFVGWEWAVEKGRLFKNCTPILPLSMFKSRTQIGCCLESFWTMLILLIGIYELPLLYQAKGHSATKSGIDILPFMMFTVFGAGGSGAIITWKGRYWWFLCISPLIASIASGLLFTIDADTSNAKLIGYQVLLGFGLGCCLQTTFIAIQAEFNDREDLIPQASSMVTFTQLTGGIIGVAIAGTIFANRLVIELADRAPSLTPLQAESVRQSVLAIFTLTMEQQEAVVAAYTKSVAYIFLLPIPAGILASLCSFLIHDHDIKKMNLGAAGGA